MSETPDGGLFPGPDATWLAGGHRRRGAFGGSDVWLTPPDLIAALGPFDLDPCAAPDPRPWPTATRHFRPPGFDGLREPWAGRVWLNPPYSDATRWLQRLAEHGHGTALIFARTETAAFQDWVWPHATGLLFLRGRLTFHRPDGRPGRGTAGAPSVLVAYGDDDAARLDAAASSSAVPGHYVAQHPSPCQHPSSTGDEGPVRDLGSAHVVRWRCDACGTVHYSDHALARVRAEHRATQDPDAAKSD